MIRYALVLVFSLVFSQTAFAQERMGPIPAEKMTDFQKKAAADHTAAPISRTLCNVSVSPRHTRPNNLHAGGHVIPALKQWIFVKPGNPQ